MKPILKWAGGKSRLAPQIAEAFAEPCGGTYYEPFVGSAAVYLHLAERGLVRRAVLSDANDKLCEVHRAVRDDVEGVLDALAAAPEEPARSCGIQWCDGPRKAGRVRRAHTGSAKRREGHA